MLAADRDIRPTRVTVHRARDEFDSAPIAAAITTRGKELRLHDTVGTARRLFACHPVRALPVLRGAAYVGAVIEGAIDEAVPADAPIGPYVADALPTAVSDTPAPDALALLDRSGGQRLVVLEPDGSTYVGLVCMRRDRRRLCVAAEQPERAPRTPDGGARG